MTRAATVLFSAFAAACLAQPAQAQEFISKHGDWMVFSAQKGGSKICYIASKPTKTTGSVGERDNAYVLVTARNAKTDEVSVSSGYGYKVDSKVKVEVDSAKYEFFTKDAIAWAYDAKQDGQVIAGLKKGTKLTVRGTSPQDAFSLDTYSLKGISAAYAKMKASCK